MASGQFDNLKYAGKPLPQTSEYNHYVDFTTHKMNEILLESDFAPEWVEIQKEIRSQTQAVQMELKECR